MARAGRKRNSMSQRYPSGEVKKSALQQQKDREEVIKTRMRLYDLPYQQAAHERAGSALGRAYFYRQITDGMYLAGVEYERRWVKWAMVTDTPMPHARAMDYAKEVGGGQGGYLSAYFIEAAKRRMEEAGIALKIIGPAAEKLVKGVVIDDQSTAAWDGSKVLPLRMGLSALVDIFGLPDAGFLDTRVRGGVL